MVTWSDLGDSFWISACLFVLSLLVFLPCYGATGIFFRVTKFHQRGKAVLLAGLMSGLPLGFIGIVAGFLTGPSRAPAVGAVVPAILTFIGLMVVYLLGKGRLRSVITGFAVLVFTADFVVGTVLGTASRERHDERLASLEYLKFKADQEFALRQYRRALGLPLDAPQAKPSGSTAAETRP
jgi:hypothetical protein